MIRIGGILAGLALILAAPAHAEEQIGSAFPDDFPTIMDASLDQPVIGFGSDVGPVRRTPVIFLHGNNDTPYPTDCNGGYGKIQAFAQHFLNAGYSPKELWALGYQGEQCDLVTDPPQRSGEAHSTAANVPDLRRFVAAVLDYTGARQVDVIGHSLGTTLTREWLRQDRAYHKVRRLVGIDGPNHGIINCSPNPQNFWQQRALGGFTPDSAICREYGAADTPFLRRLNRRDETPGPTQYLMIVNTDTSFVYFDRQDGVVPPVPAEDRNGRPHDFSRSARLRGSATAEVTGQGRFDDVLRAAHTGIVNSPEVWDLTLQFLADDFARPSRDQREQDRAPEGVPAEGLARDGGAAERTLPATGAGAPLWGAGLLGLGVAVARWRHRLRAPFAEAEGGSGGRGLGQPTQKMGTNAHAGQPPSGRHHGPG